MNLIQSSPVTKLVSVTPQFAEEILKLNTNNRKPNENRVAELADDMTSGRYQLTGDSVCVSKTGVLLNGQHRLMASVRTGSTVMMNLILGLDDEAQFFIDTGLGRSFGQQVGLQGRKNAQLVGAAIKSIAGFLTGTERKHKSHGELQQFLNMYGDDVDHVLSVIGTAHRADIVGAMAMARNVHGYKQVVDEFGVRLKSRKSSGVADPVGTLTAYTRRVNTHDKLFERTLNALRAVKDGVNMERLHTNAEVTEFFKERAAQP